MVKRTIFFLLFASMASFTTVQSITDLPELVSLPLSYSDINPEKHFFKLNTFVRFMQGHVICMIDNRPPFFLRGMKYYHKNIPKIRKEMELWIVKEDLAGPVRDSAAVHDLSFITHE